MASQNRRPPLTTEIRDNRTRTTHRRIAGVALSGGELPRAIERRCLFP